MTKWEVRVFLTNRAKYDRGELWIGDVWEKKRRDGKTDLDDVRELGAEGWMPFSVLPINEDGNTVRLLFFFRRPVQD